MNNCKNNSPKDIFIVNTPSGQGLMGPRGATDATGPTGPTGATGAPGGGIIEIGKITTIPPSE